MKRILLLSLASLGIILSINSCKKPEEDTCSNDLGNIQDDYNCELPVAPQICTINGVDDHWILDGVEYACPNSDCTNIPQDMIDVMQDDYGCGNSKSAEFLAANKRISERAKVILERLRADSQLCDD